MVPNILIGANETPGAARPSVLLPPSAGTEGQAFFDGALLDNAVHKRKTADWLISLTVHAAIVAALIVVPLFFTQALDLTRSEITYLAPPPPPSRRLLACCRRFGYASDAQAAAPALHADHAHRFRGK